MDMRWPRRSIGLRVLFERGAPGSAWSVLPAPVPIAPGGVVELAAVVLSPIPIPDDLDTAGHEGVGTVSCVARRHDQPGDEGEVCCGAPMQDSPLRGRRCVRRAPRLPSRRGIRGRF
jgi:hypothetical protein